MRLMLPTRVAMAGQTMGAYFVENDGDGLPGTDTEIAELFSIARPLLSSKLLRLPTRGALGNGLRVVVGAVLASGGELIVKTRGRALRLRPRDTDGRTDVEHVEPWDGHGTRIEVRMGDALSVADSTFMWADQIAEMAAIDGQRYHGATSPWWYDSDSFYELTQAAGARSVRDLVEGFAGCSGGKAGKVAAEFIGCACELLTREQAERLLATMRAVSRQVKPKRLGAIGQQYRPQAGYARELGTFEARAARGSLSATIPVVVEAWVSSANEPEILCHVNRTPITAEINVSRCFQNKADYGLKGCGLSSEHRNTAHLIKAGRGREFSIVLNINTPYMPITTDGKAPDLSVIVEMIQDAIEKAIGRAKRKNVNGKGRQISQASIMTEAIPARVSFVSGEGKYRYSLRQLFYQIRPVIERALPVEVNYNYYGKVVTDYEAGLGEDLPGMYRDDRGTLYHPHSGEHIPLGTRSVEAYSRPPWTFNKVLYCEKEGFFPILIDAQWPERHDCALLTSKGFASRAARDVLDLLGDTDEPLTFFCLHDADGPGTMIYQALQEGTKARPGRRFEIINLGLEPEEALVMGLPKEAVVRKGNKTVAVARYIEPQWRQWLQGNRVELNAMSTPQLLDWLDRKMASYAGKLIPDVPVLQSQLRGSARDLVAKRLIDEAIRDTRVYERTDEVVKSLEAALQTPDLRSVVKDALSHDSAKHWSAPIQSLAARIVENGGASCTTI